MSANKPLYYTLITLTSLTLALTLFYMPLRTWCVFISVGILGIAYTFPVIPTPKGWKRLRDIYWLKTFWIALAFSILTTFLPVLYFQPISSILKPPVLFIFFRALLFIFSICIPFDIRDIHFDKLKQVRTLPVILGPSASIYIAIALMLLFLSLVCIQFLYFSLNLHFTYALFASALITILLLLLSKRKRSALLYPLLYDGSMLLQCLLIIISRG
jgi:4-hydroxybenzoate polyprenyltransferase